MLNVQALTHTLSAMPLAQLQQYAALHKNDPYVVTMALSIANQKKQAAAAQQGQAGMQPQPKVVDQDIADMAPQALPEQSGIGQLPAQNMQGMADGGIVGYAGNDESLVRNPFAFLNPGDIASNLWGGAKRIFSEGIDPVAAQQRRMAEAALADQNVSGMDRRLAAPAPMRTAPMQANMTVPGGAGQPPAPAPEMVAPGAVPPAPAGAGMPSQADLTRQYQDILSKTKAVDPAAAERASLGELGIQQAEARQKAYDAEQAARGDVYKGREERLGKQEAEINSRKATNEGLAFLNAGLAIMSTPGGLATAIGKGARVGTEQYAAGLDKIHAAQEKLDESRDRLDDLRINRADLSAKERRTLQAEADKAKMDAKSLGIEGIMAAAGVKEKQAAAIFDANTKVGIARIQEQGAAARAARNPQLELLQAINRDPKLASAYQAMHGTKGDLMSQYTDYLGKNPAGTIEDFMKTKALFSALSGVTAKPVSALPSNAVVAPRAP